jgi:hypothetical protein
MKKYIVIYHAPDELVAQTANSSPEEMEKGMETWMAWDGACEIEVHEVMPLPD